MVKIYIIAGEESGDKIGAELITNLANANIYDEIQLYGVAASHIGKAAAEICPAGFSFESLFPMEEISLMGIAEILPHIPALLKKIRLTAADIARVKPDVIVTIDSPDFCFRVMKRLSSILPEADFKQICKIHYGAPTIWAWRKKGRARILQQLYDAVLCLYPFEPKILQKAQVNSVYLSHPARKKAYYYKKLFEDEQIKLDWYGKYDLSPNHKIIAMLPGSRKREIMQLMPIYFEALQLLQKDVPDFYVIMPTTNSSDNIVRAQIANWQDIDAELVSRLRVVNNSDDVWLGFQASSAAVVKSGTGALEIAFCQLPHIICYKTGKVSEYIFRAMSYINHAHIFNIMAYMNDKELSAGVEAPIPELLQENCNAQNIAYYSKQLLNQDSEMRCQQIDFLATQNAKFNDSNFSGLIELLQG